MLEGTIVNVKGTGFEAIPPSPAGVASWGSGVESLNVPPADRASRRKSGSVPGSGGSQKNDTYQVDTTDILFIVSGAFVGMDKIIRNRVAKGVSAPRTTVY